MSGTTILILRQFVLPAIVAAIRKEKGPDAAASVQRDFAGFKGDSLESLIAALATSSDSRRIIIETLSGVFLLMGRMSAEAIQAIADALEPKK